MTTGELELPVHVPVVELNEYVPVEALKVPTLLVELNVSVIPVMVHPLAGVIVKVFPPYNRAAVPVL